MARTEEEMEKMLSVMVDETDTAVLSTYLTLAKEKIMGRLYPYGVPDSAELPSSYDVKVLEIAAFMINKRGAEGEIQHSENGILRSYQIGDVPDELLRDIIPYASVPGSESDETTET